MKRREFIAGLGSAAAWPVVARAQQPAVPVIGVILTQSADDDYKNITGPFLQGLKETGYIDGQNVTVEYSYAENQIDQLRLRALAADFVRRRVAVIVAQGNTVAAAAKEMTTTIPIVFAAGFDPVTSGLVASLNRPGANVTAIANLAAELAPKQLQLLRELAPNAAVFGVLADPVSPNRFKVGLVPGLHRPSANITGFSQMMNLIVAKQLELLCDAVPKADPVGFLVNPANSNAKSDADDAQAAAQSIGRTLIVAQASTDDALRAAFATLSEQGAGALLLAADVFFRGRIDQLVVLASRHRLPTLTAWREATAAGTLMSYSASQTEGYYQQGAYVGRILNGENPANLPVVLPTKFEFVINLRTAKALGLTIRETLLATADEVIQ